jgi:uncharacterized coiled-coil protein SlyX
MDISDAARLEALETKVSYLEQTLQQLSDVLYRQQLELDRVVARNQQLLDELASAPGAAGTDIEIPPHY